MNNLILSKKLRRANHLSPEERVQQHYFFDINGWALRAAVIGFLAGCIALVIPQWYYSIENAVSFGLRTQCSGNSCNTISFPSLQSKLNCQNTCNDKFDQFRLRWRAVEGFGWAGAVLLMFVAFSSIQSGLEALERHTSSLPSPLSAA
jgi:hypothetical protein